MTITALPTRNEYTATAGQTVFNYTFKIFSSTDVNCYVTPPGQQANDSADIVTINTVTGVGDEDGGSIEIDPVSAGSLVTVISNITEERLTDYQNNGDYRASVVNEDFDRVVSIVKQLSDYTTRGLTFQLSEQAASGLTLPNPIALNVLQWKPDVTGLQNLEVLSEIVTLYSVNTIAGLRAVDASTLTDSVTIVVNGYYERGDGGGGPIRYLNKGQSPGTFVDNGGSIIVPNGGDGSTAWLFQDNQNIINMKWFGVKGDGVPGDAARIQAVLNSELPKYNDVMIVFPNGYTFELETEVFSYMPERTHIVAIGANFTGSFIGTMFSALPDESGSLYWTGGTFENTGGISVNCRLFGYSFFDQLIISGVTVKSFKTGITISNQGGSYTLQDSSFTDNGLSMYFYQCNYSIRNIINNRFYDANEGHMLDEGPRVGRLNVSNNWFYHESKTPGDKTLIINNTLADAGAAPATISDNEFQGGNSSQIYLYLEGVESGSSYNFRGVKITGNTFQEPFPTAILIEHCDGIDITGNSFEQVVASGGKSIDAGEWSNTWVHVGANRYVDAYPVIPNDSTGIVTNFPYFQTTGAPLLSFIEDVYSTSSFTIDMSTEMAGYPEIRPRGFQLRIWAKDSGSNLAGDLYVEVGVGLQKKRWLRCLIHSGTPNNLERSASGHIQVDSSSTNLDVNIVASGTDTMTISIYVMAVDF
jgi:hypothetical protein